MNTETIQKQEELTCPSRDDLNKSIEKREEAFEALNAERKRNDFLKSHLIICGIAK